MGERDSKSAARRLLAALENGGKPPADTAFLAQDLDPVLVYTVISFLRAVYPVSDPAASSVLERVVRLISSSPAMVGRYKQGGLDPVSRWLEAEHEYRDFRGRGEELIDRVVDKLES